MSEILEQLAGIKILLQEQAEECALRAKYEQERREAVDKQRVETDVMEAQTREKLREIIDKRENARAHGKVVESSADIDVIMELIRENHGNQMEMIQTFINTTANQVVERNIPHSPKVLTICGKNVSVADVFLLVCDVHPRSPARTCIFSLLVRGDYTRLPLKSDFRWRKCAYGNLVEESVEAEFVLFNFDAPILRSGVADIQSVGGR
ncbi:hypothetical protein B0H12DRAFT_1070001 [Mycena haematopus]|nr:hypothetical protein B0H12DRAFT_1070001 [Mycena haematopus]